MSDALLQATRAMTDSNQALRESIVAGFAEVNKSLDTVAVNIAQLSQMVKQQSQSIDRLTDRIDRLTERIDRLASTVERQAQSIDAHLLVAQQQAANVAQLTTLANTLLQRLAA